VRLALTIAAGIASAATESERRARMTMRNRIQSAAALAGIRLAAVTDVNVLVARSGERLGSATIEALARSAPARV